jgi:hypothetical protein
MSDIFDETPDENEQYESLDEALDEEDLPGHSGASEGARDLDVDVIVDRTALEEVGAQLDDSEQMSMLDGGIDDPDGAGPPAARDDPDAGWDVDPVVADHEQGQQADAGAEGDAVTGDVLEDVPELQQDPELEIVATDALELEEVSDDAPGADSARW